MITDSKRNIEMVENNLIGLATVIHTKNSQELVKNERVIADMIGLKLQNIQSEDSECEPHLEFISTQLYLYQIDKKAAKETFISFCDYINKSSDMTQRLIESLNTNFMSLQYMNDYNKELRLFCASLRSFGKYAKNINSKNEIQKLSNSVKFAFKNLEKKYNETLSLIGEKRKIDQKSVIDVFSIIKWIWKYKFSMYILGVLLYNIYDLVYLPGPITNFLSFFTRIWGAICYTFFK
jgi:hypothetical protein